MKSTTVRRAALSFAVVAALTGAAACTSSGSSDSSGSSGEDGGTVGRSATHMSAVAALRSAEKSTDRADSARVESTTTMGSMMSMKAAGALGWGDGITGTLTITYTGGTLADTMRQLGTTSMEARYLPDAYYAKMGDAFAEKANGKHWIRYAYDDLEDLGGGSGAYLKNQMRNTTPNQSVQLLLASGDVKRVGEERVRDENTTHYSGTVDVADLAGQDSGLSEKQLADLKDQLTQAGVTTQTVDIWVNAHELLVKKVEKGEMASGRLTQTAYYSGYGVKVSAKKPPVRDTEDFKELLKRQGNEGGLGGRS